MTLNKDLLAILCCPETKQPVHLADLTLIQRVNAAITKGHLKNRGDKPVSTLLDGGLLRDDQKILYPIREQIPVLLIEEGIPLNQVPG